MKSSITRALLVAATLVTAAVGAPAAGAAAQAPPGPGYVTAAEGLAIPQDSPDYQAPGAEGLVTGPTPLSTGGGKHCFGRGTYTHCETITCSTADVYFYYSPGDDDFRGSAGVSYSRGERVSIRDEPHRREGARGVRITYDDHRWGWISVNCL